MIKLEIVLVLLLVRGSQMEVEGARQDLQDRLGLLGSALGLDPLGTTDDTSEDDDENEDGGEEEYDSPLASVSYFDYDYDDVSEEDFNNTEEAAVTTTPRPTTIPSSVSTTTNIPSIGNTDVVLEEFTAEEQCCCLPISSCPSVSANLMVEVEETVNTSSTTTPSPSRVIFRSGLGAVGGCNEGEVRCCEGCNEVPLLGREISCGQEGVGEAELAPWACVLLTRDNGFVGTCVILGPSTVATAAHKLNKILLPSQLKVRVGDFDLRGFNQPEQSKHTEFVVDDIVRHPEFNPKRLSHDLALVFLESEMEMQESNVGSICLPTFREEFTSGENIECRVNGWGTHPTNGALMPVMGSHKVQIVSPPDCNASIKEALAVRLPGSGDRFSLSSTEVCASSFNETEQQCGGDGGSPLVCRDPSSPWTLVGLVTWAVGCEGPVVHARVGHFLDWIENTTIAAGKVPASQISELVEEENAGCPTEQPSLGTDCSLPDSLQCKYGEECCCGECSASLVLSCFGGSWGGFHTDFCFRPGADNC